jgi:hypothetical protein
LKTIIGNQTTLDEEDAPDPCPASFDDMAQLLQCWPTNATLERWEEHRASPGFAENSKKAPKWNGASQIVRGGNRGAVAVERPSRRVQSWQEMRERIGVLKGTPIRE